MKAALTSSSQTALGLERRREEWRVESPVESRRETVVSGQIAAGAQPSDYDIENLYRRVSREVTAKVRHTIVQLGARKRSGAVNVVQGSPGVMIAPM